MLKTPRAPVSGFTPQVSRATPGTAQQVAKDTASSGLQEKEQGPHFPLPFVRLHVLAERWGGGAGRRAWRPPGPGHPLDANHDGAGGMCLQELGLLPLALPVGTHAVKRVGATAPQIPLEALLCPSPAWSCPSHPIRIRAGWRPPLLTGLTRGLPHTAPALHTGLPSFSGFSCFIVFIFESVTEAQWVYEVAIVSAVQQNDSARHVRVHSSSDSFPMQIFTDPWVALRVL